jgi:hypothetical protein
MTVSAFFNLNLKSMGIMALDTRIITGDMFIRPKYVVPSYEYSPFAAVT